MTTPQPPTFTRLASGYWHVRWSQQIWAQWPIGRPVERGDFFQPEWSYSDARADEANRLTGGIP